MTDTIKGNELTGLLSDWLLELADHGIIITDAQLSIRNWNFWLATETGMPAESVVGRNLFEIVPSMVERKLDSYYQQALNGQVVLLAQKFHHYLIPVKFHGSDSLMQQRARIVPLIRDSTVVGTATIIDDVTERLERENSLLRDLEVNSIMADLSRRLLTSNSNANVADQILQAAKKLTGSIFGYVGQIDPESGYLTSTAHAGAEVNDCRVAEKDVLFKEFRGLCGWVLKNGQPLLTNDAANDLRSAGLPEGHMPIRQFLSVPVIFNDNLLGQIALANSTRDYTAKDINVIERLAMLYAMSLNRNQLETARITLLVELQEALDNIKKLSGLLPFCMICKKIRDDSGYWQSVEVFIMEHTEAMCSHGLCPDCAKIQMDEFRMSIASK